MAITEVVIGKSKYKIECPENQQEKLARLAAKVDEKARNLLSDLKNIDEKTLLAIVAITLEDELESHLHSHHAKNYTEENSHTINSLENNSQDEEATYEALSENIENVADYIEKLAKKIENY